MPEWFKTLALITLSFMMVSLLLSVSGAFIVVAVVSAKDWLKERKQRRR